MQMWGFWSLYAVATVRNMVLIKSLNLNPPAVLRLTVHNALISYKYASALIWMLGKNNLDSLQSLPVASDTGKDGKLRFRIAVKTEAVRLWR
jgi:hypothetical protein